MKKCPDKKLLFGLDDSEMTIDDRVKLETHLQHCDKCRKLVQEARIAEEELKSRVASIFVPKVIKNAAMQQIRLFANSKAEVEKIDRRFAWLWILVSGIAIILFAALSSSKPVHRHNAILVNCHASSERSRVNNQAIEFGHQINIEQLPMKFEGNFVFTLIATSTSSFEHSGISDLVDASFEKLEFANASATFTLISGNPIQIIINGLKRKIDVYPIRVKNTVRHIQTNTDTLASAGHSLKSLNNTVSGPAECNLATSVTESENLPSMATSVDEVSDVDVVAPASIEEPIVDETVNPFLDKPLLLNGD